MDGSELIQASEAAIAVVTLAGFLLAFRSDRRKIAKEAEEKPRLIMIEAVRPIQQTLDQHSADIRNIHTAIAESRQWQSDHEKNCDKRGERIEAMFQEIRNDVKDIMRDQR
jgi:16S rRNA C1402 (ribose-2'-O) methylase RsmI